MIGKTLNHYRVLEKIGAGGMGEVYVAEDTTLNRRVALKVLPPAMAANPDRLGRFEREAKAVAALNHPNIVTIHSIENSDPGDGGDRIHFLTMELVEGKTLGHSIPNGGMTLGPLLEVGLALTEAMTAAHDKNITHRDLKPDNLMIGADGRLKILDFGLAKLKEETAGRQLGSELPTQVVATEEGKILGTVAYMSPEQAEGKEVDARSDIFSIGVLLYQMATGERPFKGDTKISVISSIMRDTPTSVSQLNRALPRHLGRIVKRCLAKDPLRRYGNARELYNDLLELKEELDSGELQAGGGAQPPARTRPNRVVLAAAGVIVVVAVVAAFLLGRRPGAPGRSAAPVVEATFTRLTQLPGMENRPSLSPDGRMLVYEWGEGPEPDIYFQIVGGEKVINLTEDHAGWDGEPAFSPDGSRIAFTSDRGTAGDSSGVFLMGTTGESVRRLSEKGANPAWSPDGREVVFSTIWFENPYGRTGHGDLRAVDIETGAIRDISVDQDAVQPHWSPHGHRIAFWGLRAGSGQRDIWTVPAAGGVAVAITDDNYTDWNPVWSPDGGFLYFASNRGGSMNLWRVPIDEASGRTLGPPQPVTSGVTDTGYISIAADGRRIAYASMSGDINYMRVGLDPVAEQVTGTPEWMTRGSNSYLWVAPSPDNEWVSFTQAGEGEDLVVARPNGTGRRRLTNDSSKSRGGKWSPDGEWIAFYSDRSGSYEIWKVRPDGSELTRLTDTPGTTLTFPAWSPDGSRIAVNISGGSGLIFEVATPWADQDPERLPTYPEEGEIELMSWSPDGNWIAGSYLNPGGDLGGIVIWSTETKEYRLLTDFGVYPEWLNDSRRILFHDDSRILISDRNTGETREILSVAPEIINKLGLSFDNRTLYIPAGHWESDIWLLEFK